MTTHRVIYEMASDGSWSACAADLPVFSVGETREEAEEEIQQAIRLYLDTTADESASVPTVHRVTGTVTA